MPSGWHHCRRDLFPRRPRARVQGRSAEVPPGALKGSSGITETEGPMKPEEPQETGQPDATPCPQAAGTEKELPRRAVLGQLVKLERGLRQREVLGFGHRAVDA